MSAGTHDSVGGNVSQPKRRMPWMLGGAAVAIVAAGLFMQYHRAPSTKAATEGPAAGTARLNAKKPEALARVGKETISYEAVAQECVERHGREVLDDLIHRLIIQQACDAQGVMVSDREVDEEISRIAKKFNLDVPTWLQMLQAERNMNPGQYRASVIWPMIALKKLAGEEVEISEDDIKKAFVRNYGPRVKARVIMLNSERRARDCWEEARKDPDKFEQLAQVYSVDPNSRALGGQVPPIPRYSGNDDVEKVAFKLKEGELSGIVQVGTNQYAILKCEGRTEPVVTDIEEVRSALYDELKEVKTQQSVAKVFEQIKKQTRVDNYLTQTTSGPDRMSTGAAGQVQPVSAQGRPQGNTGSKAPVTAEKPGVKPARN